MNFEQYLQQKGMVKKTIVRHKREAEYYEKWLETRNKTAFDCAKKDLLDYLQHIRQTRNVANVTINHILQRLKNYHSYLSHVYHLPNISYFIKIQGLEQKKLRYTFTTKELDLLCDAYYYHTQEYKATPKELLFYPYHQRLLQGRYLYLTLTAYQALSANEILLLTKANFDMLKARVSIPQSRRINARVLPLEATQIGVLMQYFDYDDSPIIPNRSQIGHLNHTLKSLHPKYEDLRQVRASRISYWIKIYGLRRTQHMVGHKGIRSTEKYLANDYENLSKEIENFHPFK